MDFVADEFGLDRSKEAQVPDRFVLQEPRDFWTFLPNFSNVRPTTRTNKLLLCRPRPADFRKSGLVRQALSIGARGAPHNLPRKQNQAQLAGKLGQP